MRRRTRQTALTVGAALLAAILLATGVLAMVNQSSPSHRSAPVPVETFQDAGPEAFGVLPAIRPRDGNGLDFNGPGILPDSSNPMVDFSGQHPQALYTIDAIPALPESAPVIRPDVPMSSEQGLRDLAARLGMTGPLQVSHLGMIWDDTGTVTDLTSGARLSLRVRGGFSYSAPDPGARCGETANTPPPYPTPAVRAVPATATATPFGVGSTLCTSRNPALDDPSAATIARDFLSKMGFLPDASSSMQVQPPDAKTPTLRPVRWTSIAPNGGRFIGRDAQRDFVVMVGPDGNVTSASGPTATSGASSLYRLRSTADLAAALQSGDAYATLTLPLSASGLPILFQRDQPVDLHVTGAELGYSLAYTFDAQPYLLPVVIYTGTANTAESRALGKEIAFTAYVDAVLHPAPQPVPVTPTVPLPATPDVASLASFTMSGPTFTRADFDALASALGLDNTTATITSTPSANGEAFLAKYPDGANLSTSEPSGGWQYDNGGRPDAALALAQQFIAAHHIDLSNLGAPTTEQLSGGPTAMVCYPLRINGIPIADGRCGLRAFVESGGKHFLFAADALLVMVQRSGMAALQPAPATGSVAVSAQDALDTLATAPQPLPDDAHRSQAQGQLGRLAIADDPEQAMHHRGSNIFSATRGQAAPNQFTADRVTLAYLLTIAPGSTPYHLTPVWLISGQIDVGNRHRVLPFTYLSPALQ